MNRKQCAYFINYIGKDMENSLQERLSDVNFFSVLTDGSTDASAIENEAVFVRCMEKTLTRISFVDLADLKTGKAKEIGEAIQMSFEEIGAVDDLIKKFVAFGADGANTNSGENGGAIALLKEKYDGWIVFMFPTGLNWV